MSYQDFINVSLAEPCANCDSGDWCSYTITGVICCRKHDKKGKSGNAIRKVDRCGSEYFLIFPEKWEGDRKAYASKYIPPQDIILDTPVLHEVYSAMLSVLKLSDKHKAELLKRGYSEDEIIRLGFKSCPTTKEERFAVIAEVFHTSNLTREDILKVPGFFKMLDSKDEGEADMMECPEGYFLPSRNQDGQINKLIIRVDNPGRAGKYISFSAVRKGGVKSPSTVHFPKVPEGMSLKKIRIVGGFHKAEIATKLSGIYTIGLASETSYRLGLQAAIDMGAEEVIISIDGDARSNPAIAGTLCRFLVAFQQNMLNPRLEVWSHTYGKAIDDVLRDGHGAHVMIKSGTMMWETAAEIVRSAGKKKDMVIDAYSKLEDFVERTKKDQTHAYSTGIRQALPYLDPMSRHYQYCIQFCKKKMGARNFKPLEDEIKATREKLMEMEREEVAEAMGKTVLDRNTHPAIAKHILDELTFYGNKSHPEWLVHDQGAFYLYRQETGIWSEISDNEIRDLVNDLDGDTMADGSDLRITQQLSEAVMRTIRDMRTPKTGMKGGKKKSFFDDAPKVVVFENGYVTIDKKGIHFENCHSSANKARFRYEFAWNEYGDAHDPEQYLAMLKRAWGNEPDYEARVAYHQENMGAIITGNAVQYHKVTVYLGHGNDGKSTLGRITQACMPPGSVTHCPPQKMSEDYHVGEMPGKLLNIVYELPDKELLSTAGFKKITGGDPTEGRVCGLRPVNFTPILGHIFICQSKMPPTNDFSYGFRRRFTIIRFNESVKKEDVIVDYEKHLIAEEQAEIVAWALRGMARLLKQGNYTMVESSETELDSWLRGCDVIAGWMDDATIPAIDEKNPSDKKQWGRARALYDHYISWCAMNGHKLTVSYKVFGERLAALLKISEGDKKRDAAGCIYPIKIGVKPIVDPDDAAIEAAVQENVRRV